MMALEEELRRQGPTAAQAGQSSSVGLTAADKVARSFGHQGWLAEEVYLFWSPRLAPKPRGANLGDQPPFAFRIQKSSITCNGRPMRRRKARNRGSERRESNLWILSDAVAISVRIVL